jgi:MOSC domain-containing protein YiiM
VAPDAGTPMQMVNNQTEISPTGISGDRYALNKGAYSKAQPTKVRHISLITQSGINTANEILISKGELAYSESETRRNIVLSDITPNELNNLVGVTFKLGGAILKGIELCIPCERPARLLRKTNFMQAFDGLGGLRAEVIQAGSIKPGDTLMNEESN